MSKWIPWITVAGLLLALPAGAADWSGWSDLETIEVTTVQEDGSEMVTTIWITVLEGTAYVRTSESSAWGNAVEKAETFGLRGGDEDRTVRATAINNDATRASVEDSFRQKYGFSDAMIGIFRGEARIFSVEAFTP